MRNMEQNHGFHLEIFIAMVIENDYIKNEVLNKVGIKIFIIKEEDIKNDKKYIDNKKLEELLISIYSQIKSLENKKLS